MNALSKWSLKLDAYLVRKGLSKKQLAGELGISINTLGKWWRHREPSPDHAAKIQQLLHEDASTTTITVEEIDTEPEIETDIIEAASKPPPTGFPKRGKRHERRPAIISLLRTTCPFCKHAVDRFHNCSRCGQHFVWANVLVDSAP